MPSDQCILAIDQGTTSSRAIVFDPKGQQLAVAQQEFPQHYPDDGWVEHNPEDIWSTTLATAQEAFRQAEGAGNTIVAIGITNQRETTLVWDRATGKPIHNAIVWQDRRTARVCADLKTQGLEPTIQAKTGLLLDPYFSSTKVAWLLDNVDGARAQADAGTLAFGTVDTFLIWRLTGGASHVTDATNASRTNLYNIHDGAWDDTLLSAFNVPASVLPQVLDCSADFGTTDAALFGRPLPIYGVAGDQQAATVGQCCFAPGSIKSTYGTGCFVVLNTGAEAVASKNKLLTTIAYQIDGKPTYALEGSIFMAGASVQWLRDEMGLIKSAEESEALAAGLDGNAGVYLVPAFTGLGAPHWDPDARGAIFGLTRATGPAHIVRATLESVCYQTADLFDAMAQDGVTPSALRVDGGMVANSWLCQFLADVLDLTVDRPEVMETTALGAAYLAGLKAGIYASLDDVTSQWQRNARFAPKMQAADRASLMAGWQKAVEKTLS